MKSPKISIVIPSLNKGLRIGETLTSIYKQKYQNLEVIIMDGGSADNTTSIVKKFTQKYRNLYWYSKKDNGQLDAINKGLKKITGDIVSFINADDIYEREAFKAISHAYIKNPNALWFAGYGKIINNQGQEIMKLISLYKNLFLFLNRKSLILILNYLTQPSVFLTRMAYKKYGPFTGNNDFVMEYDLWLRLSRVQMPVVINKNISKFRIEAGTKTKLMYERLLYEDSKIVKKYTSNVLVLFLHRVHNLGRVLINKFI